MMVGDPVDSLLMSLIEKEIPDGRSALIESHHNLADLSAYCKENYINSPDKARSLQETKEYASQSLASVAYQIHSLAVNILQMMDQQTIQLQKMQSNANNIGLLVDIHKEKVARREIGVLTSSKNFSRAHKVVTPAKPEKPKKYQREDIDYTALDNIGHGVRTEGREDIAQQQRQQRFSTSSSSGSLKEMNSNSSSIHSSSQGSIHANNAGLYKSNSSDRKAAFSVSTMPPPPRPPIAPVAPFKVKGGSTASGMVTGPIVAMPPLPGTLAASGEVMPPPPSPMNMPEPDYDDLDSRNLPLPPPPPLIDDLYQVPTNNLPLSPLDDLPPPPPDTMYPGDPYHGGGDHGGGDPYGNNIYEVVPPPPPPMMLMSSEGATMVPETYEEKVVAIYDYEKLREDELELHEGDIIYVIKKNEDGWFEGIKDGVQGLFPGNYVTACAEFYQ